METNTHYLKIGLFVIVFSVLLMLGLLWLSFGFNAQSYRLYHVYMHESVSGLTIKAPVKYNGVEVGYVATINLDRDSPDVVSLLLAVDDNIPIYQGTHAQLQTQGLTGIAFVNLHGGNPALPLIQVVKPHKYPEIPAAPSLFMRLDKIVDKLTFNLNEISTKVNRVLNNKNVGRVDDILKNLSTFSNALSRNSDNIDVLLKNTAQASKQLPQVLNNIDAASANAKATLSVSKTLLNSVNNQMMPEVSQTLESTQTAADNVGSLAAELQQNPSMLLRGKQAPAKGPGE